MTAPAAPRTFEVDTRDRGVLAVTEPEWCAGDHEVTEPRPPRRRTLRMLWRRLVRRVQGRGPIDYRPYASEIYHVGEPVNITVNGPGGRYRLFELMLWADAYPTPDQPFGTEPYAVARFLDGDHVDYDLAGLEGLSADLMEASGALRVQARAFSAVLGGEQS